jgi:hypothetical protein
MRRDAAGTDLFTLLARVLTTTAPAKPTQPFMVGVASDGLRR